MIIIQSLLICSFALTFRDRQTPCLCLSAVTLIIYAETHWGWMIRYNLCNICSRYYKHWDIFSPSCTSLIRLTLAETTGITAPRHRMCDVYHTTAEAVWLSTDDTVPTSQPRPVNHPRDLRIPNYGQRRYANSAPKRTYKYITTHSCPPDQTHVKIYWFIIVRTITIDSAHTFFYNIHICII